MMRSRLRARSLRVLSTMLVTALTPLTAHAVDRESLRDFPQNTTCPIHLGWPLLNGNPDTTAPPRVRPELLFVAERTQAALFFTACDDRFHHNRVTLDDTGNRLNVSLDDVKVVRKDVYDANQISYAVEAAGNGCYDNGQTPEKTVRSVFNPASFAPFTPQVPFRDTFAGTPQRWFLGTARIDDIADRLVMAEESRVNEAQETWPGRACSTARVQVRNLVPGTTYVIDFEWDVGAAQGLQAGQSVLSTFVDTTPTLEVPELIVGDVTLTEGNAGGKNFVFPVTLSMTAPQTVTVNYATNNGTASASSDYGAVSGLLTFTPGQTSKTVTVVVNGDVTNEASEIFTLGLANVSAGAILADPVGLGTITNDDNPGVSVSDVSGLEGLTGTSLTFTVTLTGPSATTVTVPYSTANNTATAGPDYGAASGVLTFAPGEISHAVSVAVVGDVSVEVNETFLLNLGTPTNATLVDAQGVGTILNDDPPVASAFADFVMLGAVYPATVSNVAPTRWLKARLVAGRSYSASVWAPSTDPTENPVSLDVTWFLDDGATLADGASATEFEPLPDTAGHNGDAESIIPTAVQCTVPTGCTYRLRVQATGATTNVPVRVSVVETTLVSPYWLVLTAAGYDAAPMMRNNTSTTIPITFTAFGYLGNVLCSSSFTLVANGMLTFPIGGAPPGCGIADGFGSATFAFHGPPGSISANITTFSANSGLSFDSPSKPRNDWSLRGAK